jgi:hypothetical protein
MCADGLDGFRTPSLPFRERRHAGVADRRADVDLLQCMALCDPQDSGVTFTRSGKIHTEKRMVLSRSVGQFTPGFALVSVMHSKL